MINKIYVFDPTLSDSQSQVRGIGRYLQIMKENLASAVIFTNGKDIAYDSILVHPFFNFLNSRFLLKKVAKKQIAVIHDLIPLKFPQHFPLGFKGKIKMMVNKLALNQYYDLIITDSHTVKQDLIQLLQIPPTKIKVIYPTLPKIFWQKNNSHKKSANYCLYVGDGTWNKNLVNLAKAIKLSNKKCLLVGKVFSHHQSLNHPWQKELHTFFQLIQADSRFVLKGFVSDEALIELYQQASINLLLSHDEGFGFSYLEALSQHCPSILADIPLFREIAGNTALYVNQNDPQAIAQAIFKADYLISLSTTDLSRFSPNNFKKQWFNCFQNL